MSNVCLQLKNGKENSAPDGGGRSNMIDIVGPDEESVLRHDADPYHQSLLDPEGVQFVLHNILVRYNHP